MPKSVPCDIEAETRKGGGAGGGQGTEGQAECAGPGASTPQRKYKSPGQELSIPQTGREEAHMDHENFREMATEEFFLV